MAVIKLEHKDAEHRMLVLLLKHFDWEAVECFPNVGLFDWESDLLVVTVSGYMTEVEVKHSLADWRADVKKPKFVNPQFSARVKRFYYAVPTDVYEKYLADPFELPGKAGILVYGHSEFARFSEVRACTPRPSTTPITGPERKRLHRSVYCRFCRQYIKGIPKPPDRRPKHQPWPS